MTIEAGQEIPQASFKVMGADGIQNVTTDEVFKGKRVVLFAVPGAFTPTCSDDHLPGFMVRSAEIKAKGVDTIACVAVNDVFVMNAWAKARNVGDHISMLSDGNGEFTKALGLELDASGFGMGTRSRRYAALIDDGVVKLLHVEPAGGVTVSGAEAILEAL